jgi:probable HAF family extracellular repeat protein
MVLGVLFFAASPGAEMYAQKTTATYTFTDLGELPGIPYDESIAYAINDAGEIVGYSYSSGPMAVQERAVVWAKNAAGNYVVNDLGIQGQASGINSRGEVALQNYLIEPVTINGSLVWYLDLNGDGINDLLTPIGPPTISASAINDDVQILAGNDVIQYDGAGNEIITTLPNGGFACAINDYGEVAGADENSQATIWQIDTRGNILATDTLPMLRGYSISSALGIDSQGRAVGYSAYFHAYQLREHATLWTSPSDPPIDLGVLQVGGTSQAWSINTVNNVLHVVGGASVPSGAVDAFVWKNGVMTDLNKLISVSGVSLQVAVSINSSGQIVGTARVTVGKTVEMHAFLLTPN